MIVIVLRYLIPRGFRGISLFPFILLKSKKEKQNLVVLNHEKIHIRQQLEMLVVPFYVWYFFEFLFKWIYLKNKNLAYLNISFEKEAYAHENDLGYLKQRTFWNFLEYM